MPLPALQNRTVRLIIISMASLGVVVTLVGSATLSFRQSRTNAIQSLEEKADIWSDAAWLVISSARSKLRLLDEATRGEVSARTATALRRLVFENTLYREAAMVVDGMVVCSDTGVLSDPLPAEREFQVLGDRGNVVLSKRDGGEDKGHAIVINYNTGKKHSISLVIPTPGLGELMRFGDHKSDTAVFFLSTAGVVLDRSVNAASIPFPGMKALASRGLSETADSLIFTKPIPGYPYVVVAVMPKESLFKIWSGSLPLYGGLAVLLAGSFFAAALMASAQTRSLESELREAARLRQIVAHYQPILNLATGRCDGLEVLMRWQHPKRGLIPPAVFIPEAERTGVITELTERLMVEAFRELAPVFADYPNLHAAINVPVQTITNPAFPGHVDRLIRGRFQFRQLSFELTESTSLNDSSLAQLHAMKDLGIRLAVDDFGTGYSNLRYLSVFPFDFLKIDKAFVDGITPEGKSSGLVDQIVSIGRACGLQLIAEGIEHQRQADYLTALGVEYGQGFHFAAPMPIEKLREWLAKKMPKGAVTANP